MEHTLHFYGLVNDEASIDEMKNFIYSFMNYYGTFIIYLYNERKNVFTERMKFSKILDF
ncbi:Plasmodium exported protein, unknown function, fragment [Plasmodium sp. gorilla clade G1]|nr:Plasmodium exported protein, unknown function, fragment [Plasmodium sp. gorilla clade G1]